MPENRLGRRDRFDGRVVGLLGQVPLGERTAPRHGGHNLALWCTLFLLGQTLGSMINGRVKLAVYFVVLRLSADHPGKFERVGCATGEVEEGKLEEFIRFSSRESVITVV